MIKCYMLIWYIDIVNFILLFFRYFFLIRINWSLLEFIIGVLLLFREINNCVGINNNNFFNNKFDFFNNCNVCISLYGILFIW